MSTQKKREVKDHISDKMKFHIKCLELHKAAVEGDMKKAIVLAEENVPLMVRTAITEKNETVLHVAAGAKQSRFLEKLMEKIEPKDLELEDKLGNNVFCYAVMAGDIQIALKMLKVNPKLSGIRGSGNQTPLYLAALFGHSDLALFLYETTRGSETENGIELGINDRGDIFFASIRNNLHDLALKLLKDDKSLAMVRYEGYGTALHMLARSPSAFSSKRSTGLLKIVINFIFPGMNLHDDGRDMTTKALELVRCLWQAILERNDKNVRQVMHENNKLLFDAAKLGNSKFLAELIRKYPFLVHELDEEGRTIFHIAIFHRHVTIFNLLDNLGFDRQLIATYEDKHGNNLLHLAATYSYNPRPLSMVPGAALEMQQELNIFKEVESLVMPSFRERKNKKGLTPRQLFTQSHRDLLKSGEKWMKDTANSCIAANIATVIFLVAFGGPKDYNNDGIPDRKFAIANSVALSFSLISVLTFLSIRISRYAEEDFVISLPVKLLVGFLTLLISITTMMLSFSLRFFLAYDGDKSESIPILISVLVYVPVYLLLLFHGGLLKGMFLSSFRSKISIWGVHLQRQLRSSRK